MPVGVRPGSWARASGRTCGQAPPIDSPRSTLTLHPCHPACPRAGVRMCARLHCAAAVVGVGRLQGWAELEDPLPEWSVEEVQDGEGDGEGEEDGEEDGDEDGEGEGKEAQQDEDGGEGEAGSGGGVVAAGTPVGRGAAPTAGSRR